MKILFFSDLHAYKFNTNVSVINGVHSRVHYTLEVLIQILEYAKKNGITEVFFGGDLYHTKSILDVSIQEMVYNILCKYKGVINYHFIAGNHDIGQEKYCALTPLQGVGSVYLTPTTITLPDQTTIAMVPYQYSLTILTQAFSNNPADILLAHLGVTSAKVNGKEMKDGDIDLKTLKSFGYKKIFLGHWHDPECIKDSIVKYIGAPIHTASDDRGDRGFLVYDTTAHTYEEVYTSFPKFIKFSDEDLVGVTSEVLLGLCEENYVEIKTKVPQQFAQLNELTPVVIIENKEIPKVEHRLDISISETDEVMFKKYLEKFYLASDSSALERIYQLALKIKNRSEQV